MDDEFDDFEAQIQSDELIPLDYDEDDLVEDDLDGEDDEVISDDDDLRHYSREWDEDDDDAFDWDND